jgi:NAD(P)-dependent dehydrogenase (short-subunit alcohol dehydrogenase family)
LWQEKPGEEENRMRLDGKTVLVTGASRGIGAAIVRALAAAGGAIVVHYGRSRAAAEGLAAEVGAERCRLVGADLAEPGGADRLWDGAVGWRGRIDILVNNAGIYEATPIEGEGPEWTDGWARTLQVNLVAVADLCRRAVRHFRAGDGGAIVNIASRAAFRGDAPDYTAYAASKGGLIALTRTLARAYAKDGILVYAVAPGFTATEMAEDYMRVPENCARVLGEIPLGAIVPPEEVANVVVFLASGLARHATGATIDLNGASYVR